MRSALNLLIRISRPRRGSLALVLLHAWAWLEKLFGGPEAGQQARKEKKLFRPQKVLFSTARGRSAGKEGKKTKKTFQAPKSFIFYRQRPVSRQGRKKNFSGPKKFYFLSPEAGQQARKEKKLFRPQKVLFSIARGRSAGKEGKTTFQAPKSFIFYRQRPVSRQGRDQKTFQAPKSFIFYRQRPASWVDGCRSSSIQSCSRRALHLCDDVRHVTTQAQEAQRPIRLRFKNPCKRPWIVEKNFSEAEKFFSLGLDPGKKAHKLLSSFELTR